jgi:uncharacterized protein (TIGR03437 family)
MTTLQPRKGCLAIGRAVLVGFGALVFVQLATGRLAAGDLRIVLSDGIVDAGGNALLQLDLFAGDERPSAVQFDIQYPPQVSSVALSVATAAGVTKQLWTADLETGVVRVIIAGANQALIGDGPVLQLRIQLKPGTAPGRYPFGIATPSAAAADGTSIELTATGGSATVSETGAAPAIIRTVVNAASWAAGALAPGEIVVIGGDSLASDHLQGPQLTAEGRLETALAETRVLFDGIAAPLLYTTATQISAIIPYSIEGRPETVLQVERGGLRSAAVTLPLLPSAPGIYTLDASGDGQGAIVNEDGVTNGPDRPAAPGSVVVIYATGGGQTSPPGVDGAIASLGDLRLPALPVTLTIGGENAEILYAGSAEYQVAGFLQVNARIPAGIAPDDRVPVVLTIGDRRSQAGVTLAVGQQRLLF